MIACAAACVALLVATPIRTAAAPLGTASCVGPQPDGSVEPAQTLTCIINTGTEAVLNGGLRVILAGPSGAGVTGCAQIEQGATATPEFGSQCVFAITRPGPGVTFGPMLISLPASAPLGSPIQLLGTLCIAPGCGGGASPLVVTGPAAAVGGSSAGIAGSLLLVCTGTGLRGEALAGTTITCNVIAGQGATAQSALAIETSSSAQVVGCTSAIASVPVIQPNPNFPGCHFTLNTSGVSPGTRVGVAQLSIPAGTPTGTPVSVIGFDCPFQGCGGGFPLAVVGGPGALVGVAPAIPVIPAIPVSPGGGSGGGASTGSASTPHQSTISAALATPTQAFGSVGHTLASAAIVVGLMLFITFPAALFNKTLEENYDDIRDALERRLGWLRRLAARFGGGTADRRLLVFVVVLIAGAVFGGLLDPNFGANRSSAISFGAVVLAILAGMTVPAITNLTYRRVRRRPHRMALHALPFGLLVAGFCVLLSRLTQFEPGYLYGVICGIAFTDSLARNEQGHAVAIGTLATITVAVIAWLIWLPVHSAAGGAAAPAPLVLFADFLGSVFAGGLVGAVLSQLPFRFLPGGAVFAWHRGAWAITFGIAMFGLVEVMLRPQTGHQSPAAPLITTVILFALTGGLSVAFALYFQRRKHRGVEAA